MGFNFAKTIFQRLGKPVQIRNDAEIQGYGAIAGKGVELVITLGTGFGSALFQDGKLMPNLKLAHHDFRKGKTYEEQLKKKQLKKRCSALGGFPDLKRLHQEGDRLIRNSFSLRSPIYWWW